MSLFETIETEKKFTVAIAGTPSSGSIEDHLKRYILLSKGKNIVWRGLDMYAAKSGWFTFTLLLRYCFAIPEFCKDKLAEKLMLTSVSWVEMFKAKILFVGPNEVSKFSFDCTPVAILPFRFQQVAKSVNSEICLF